MSAEGLHLQKLASKQEDISDFMYEVEWQESPIPYDDQTKANPRLILSDQHGIGEALAENSQKN